MDRVERHVPVIPSVKILFAVVLIAGVAHAQDFLRNRLTLSGGYARQIGGPSLEKDTAAGLGATYGYRILPYVEPEVGVMSALERSPEMCTGHGCYSPHDRFVWIPFGLRFVLPVARGRVELSAGGGGVFEEYWVSNPNAAFGVVSRNGWGGYFAGGAAVALDRRKHFWLGATPRWFLANPTQGAHDRWFMIPGEISFRF